MSEHRPLVIDNTGVVKQIPNGNIVDPTTIPIHVREVPSGVTWTISDKQCLRAYRKLKTPAGTKIITLAGGLLVTDV